MTWALAAVSGPLPPTLTLSAAGDAGTDDHDCGTGAADYFNNDGAGGEHWYGVLDDLCGDGWSCAVYVVDCERNVAARAFVEHGWGVVGNTVERGFVCVHGAGEGL